MKINIDNTEKLTIAIKETEGKATERTVEARDIQYILHEVGDGIPKAKLLCRIYSPKLCEVVNTSMLGVTFTVLHCN